MNKYFLIAAIVSILAWYLTFLATRLDRLHGRVETSWANLDGLLQRRAAIAIEIARSEIADPASALLLTFTAHQAREASVRDRSQAESGLTGALSILLENAESISTPIELSLVQELDELTAKIKVAIAMHIEAVTRTQMVRKKFLIRFFRLAGHAPEPMVYEFEGDVF
ncbi:MAG: hypothetical protein F2851_01675 [Actinobacteria bacterium]|uniref:Unannotated protein n=1 Tax=freshwater metagenome TaxID=449393 RepID=A0A6J5YTI2_9ZZZZ|nr:hypothetical protein [Actinomycetota bacterium]